MSHLSWLFPFSIKDVAHWINQFWWECMVLIMTKIACHELVWVTLFITTTLHLDKTEYSPRTPVCFFPSFIMDPWVCFFPSSRWNFLVKLRYAPRALVAAIMAVMKESSNQNWSCFWNFIIREQNTVGTTNSSFRSWSIPDAHCVPDDFWRMAGTFRKAWIFRLRCNDINILRIFISMKYATTFVALQAITST